MSFSLRQIDRIIVAGFIRRMRGTGHAAVYMRRQGFTEREALFVLAGKLARGAA